MAFYAVRGYRPAELAAMSHAELMFLDVARARYYNELEVMFCGENNRHDPVADR